MAEISDNELAVLRRAEGLLNKMISDPKDGTNTKRQIKALVPEAKFPELEILDSVSAPLTARLSEQEKENKALRDRFDTWEKSQKDSKEENALQARLDRAKNSYGFTSEGMQKLIERMKAENSADVEATAAWVASQERKAKPISDSALMPSALNLYGSNSASADIDVVALNKDPQKWADEKMIQMLNEFANQDAA